MSLREVGAPVRAGGGRRRRRRIWLAAALAVVAGVAWFFHFYLYLGWRALMTVRTLGPAGAADTARYVSRVIRDFDLCQNKGSCLEEIERLEAEVDGRPGPTADKRLLALLESYVGRLDDSEKLWRSMLAEAPDDPDVLAGLGTLLMRRAELENCGPDAGVCIYPLPRSHHHPHRAAEAHRLFARALARRPSNRLRWLAHVTAMAEGGADGNSHGGEHAAHAVEPRVRPVALLSRLGEPGGEAMPVFVEGAAAAGVAKIDAGRGGVVADFDGDGRLDVVAGGTFAPLAYYHNRGDRTFEDRSAASGLDQVRNGFMLAAGDIDDDGDLDLYVSRNAFYGQQPNVMLKNDGHGRFTDASAESGTANPGSSVAPVFADYDLDGDLDLFVANFSTPVQNPLYAVGKYYGSVSNTLYRNRGDGTFDDVTDQAGLTDVDFNLGAAWGDIDGDGDPDLYVANYYGPNRLYLNRGDGTFVDVAPERGVTEPWSSFPAWFFDYDADGDLDLFVAAHASPETVASYLMTGEPPRLAESSRLYANDGGGRFTDVTAAAGLQIGAAVMGGNWGDANNDGFPDLYLGTGGPQLDRVEPNFFFLNRGDGTFWNATFATPLGHLQKGHAVSFADLDGDGREEIYEVLGGGWVGDAWANALYWNETPGPGGPPGSATAAGGGGHFVKVVLAGVKSNSHGVGAKVFVTAGGRTLLREIGGGQGFGTNPPMAEVGLGPAERVERLEVVWPASGTRQRFDDLPADVTILVREGAEAPELLPAAVSAKSTSTES